MTIRAHIGQSADRAALAAPEHHLVPHPLTIDTALLVTHIVPTLPPAIDGLGDYADLLSHQLQARHGVAARFLIADRQWAGERAGVERLAERTAAALLQQLTAIAPPAADHVVILHFVNYAYDGRRGIPRWLTAGLERWKAASSSHRLVTVFHELYATSWPWRKAFWYSAFQRLLAAHLCRMSEIAFTSLEAYRRWITAHRPPELAPCQAFPVPSNVGEPAAVPPLGERQPWLAIFGQAPSRSRLYRRNLPRLAGLCERLGIREIHDIGAPVPGCPSQLGGTVVRAHGRLPRQDISRLLLGARFGLIDNHGGRLAKSGVFAAYCSHGLVPITEAAYAAEDGLVTGETMISLDQTPRDPQRLASAALAWYQGHGSGALADALARSLQALLPAGR